MPAPNLWREVLQAVLGRIADPTQEAGWWLVAQLGVGEHLCSNIAAMPQIEQCCMQKNVRKTASGLAQPWLLHLYQLRWTDCIAALRLLDAHNMFALWCSPDWRGFVA